MISSVFKNVSLSHVVTGKILTSYFIDENKTQLFSLSRESYPN